MLNLLNLNNLSSPDLPGIFLALNNLQYIENLKLGVNTILVLGLPGALHSFVGKEEVTKISLKSDISSLPKLRIL